MVVPPRPRGRCDRRSNRARRRVRPRSSPRKSRRADETTAISRWTSPGDIRSRIPSAAFARPAFRDLNYHLSIHVRQAIEQFAFLKIRVTEAGSLHGAACCGPPTAAGWWSVQAREHNGRAMTVMSQPAILEPAPSPARFVSFALHAGAEPAAVLRALAAVPHDPKTVVGIGLPLAERLGRPIAGLRAFPGDVPPFPSTQHALWVWMAHGDASRLFDAGRALAGRFRGLLDVVDEVDAFGYREGRDLSGFVDGTENPKGEEAVQAAIIAGAGPRARRRQLRRGPALGARLDAVNRMTVAARAAAVGRDPETDVELADAPVSAHVKRTAQESLDPPAHILRRSMPLRRHPRARPQFRRFRRVAQPLRAAAAPNGGPRGWRQRRDPRVHAGRVGRVLLLPAAPPGALRPQRVRGLALQRLCLSETKSPSIFHYACQW